ncbi:uncharacterized protein KIAA1211-like [Chanos chanos]|uniref:Uncharacterized protein KIAA1211-like n=1 Tax=Chanos chanos TaxID=29144 RepID=A0A6J2VPF3_CHACN|nr:uncharacterized protein KIAA1211-like [Chanos chanos]
MDSSTGEIDVTGEEATGGKKSKFKSLKTRLFGKLKKKETAGEIKQSQSASDVTAPDGERGESDSEDECMYPQGTLGSRALSHDSIFLADQPQSSQPTRVLSNENVHSKIKALQLKLQQQNMRLGPPPLVIPIKRVEDPGATSEDDGLPCSPPEMSLSEAAVQLPAYRCHNTRNHLSSLSLAGTGSEEEEQVSSQPPSRPLSPVSRLSPQPVTAPLKISSTPSDAVDLSSPPQFMTRLDNSAARHRLSIKPKNQRAGTNARKLTKSGYRPRSESMTDMELTLSESEEVAESNTSKDSVRSRSFSSQVIKLSESQESLNLEDLPPTTSQPDPKETSRSSEMLQVEDNDTPSLDEVIKSEDCITADQVSLKPTLDISVPSDDNVSTSLITISPELPELSCLEDSVVIESSSTQTFSQPQDTTRNQELVVDNDQDFSVIANPEFTPVNPVKESDSTESEEIVKPRLVENVSLVSTDEKGMAEQAAPKPEVTPRPQPVPAPRTKKPSGLNRSISTLKESTVPPPVEAEKELPVVAEKATYSAPALKISASLRQKEDSHQGVREDVKPQRPNSGSFRFSVASAKYRLKTGSKQITEQDNGKMSELDVAKMPSSDQDPKQDPHKLEEDVKVHRHQSSYQEKRSSLKREVTSHNITKTTGGTTEEGAEGAAEQEKKEKTEGEEDRKGAFGVKLRNTSLSLKYRSEKAKTEAKTKRHSLEAQNVPAVSERDKPTLVEISQTSTEKNESSARFDLQTKPSLPRKPKPQSSNVPPTPAVTPVQTTEQTALKRGAPTAKSEIPPLSLSSSSSSSSSTPSSFSSSLSQHQSDSSRSQPSWMELAKRKSLAWSDKSMD